MYKINNNIAFFLDRCSFFLGYWMVSHLYKRLNLPKFGDDHCQNDTCENDTGENKKNSEDYNGISTAIYSSTDEEKVSARKKKALIERTAMLIMKPSWS